MKPVSVEKPSCKFLPVTSSPLSPSHHPRHDLHDQKQPRSPLEAPPLDDFGEETGWLHHFKRSQIVLRFNSFPVWLLGFSMESVSTLYLPQFKSRSELDQWIRGTTHPWAQLLPGLFEPFLSRLAYGDLASDAQAPTTFLVSGSVADAQHLQVTNESTLWISETPFGFRKCRQLPPTLRWTILKHAHFGGTSTYRALVGFSPDLAPPQGSTLRRKLRHMVDYSLPPTTCVDTPTLPGSYTEDDLLDIRAVQRPVIYSTRFCASRWGARCLTSAELLSICEVPPWVRHATGDNFWTADLFPVLPSSLLLACLNSALPRQHPPPLAPMSDRSLPDQHLLPAHKSWIPSLCRFLPHSWIDESMVSEKAAKADDALVPTHMWDQRISLLFPAFSRVLPQLRTRVLCRQRKNILDEIRSHLRVTYGTTWAAQLTKQRAATKGGGGKNIKPTALQRDADVMCQALRHGQKAHGGTGRGGLHYFFGAGIQITKTSLATA